jgi:hypothetical protein
LGTEKVRSAECGEYGAEGLRREGPGLEVESLGRYVGQLVDLETLAKKWVTRALLRAIDLHLDKFTAAHTIAALHRNNNKNSTD